jgi:hypothetical protein
MKETSASYLKLHLSKTLSPEAIDPAHLTYELVMKAPSQLLLYWEAVRKADVDNALAQPRAQKAAQQTKDNAAFHKFNTGQGWKEEDQHQLVENLRRIKSEFPAVVTNPRNSNAITDYLLSNHFFPNYDYIREAITTLASSGALTLDPSAVGIPEDRYGDHVEGAYQISRVSAADLRLMTEPYRPANDESKMSSTEYWAAHPELAAERYKHDRAAIEREAIRRGEAEVERFLQTQLNYEPTANNKKLMLDYIEKHCNNQLTAENLFDAFKALKPQLAQSDKALTHGSTTVVDFGPRRENPYLTTGLKDTIRRKIARYSSAEYSDWLVRHPEEAAIIDEQ